MKILTNKTFIVGVIVGAGAYYAYAMHSTKK